MEWPEAESFITNIDILYIVPDEFLYNIPLSAMVTDTTDSIRFLAQDVAIVNLPSSSFISPNKNYPGNFKNKKVLISVDPYFSKSIEFSKAIKSLYPICEELKVSDYPVTKEDVLDKFNEDHDIYVIIGHGIANSINPELSYLEVCVQYEKMKKTKKMKLTISDLKKIDWNRTELVMLMGCETAGGKLYRGTGISGLQQEFLSLGARNVLANLWKIDASFAIPQAQEILRSYTKDSDLALSVRKIQKEAINKLAQDKYYQKPHPYFWGNYKLSRVANYN
jgi:CHAT domain-containing protein